MLTLTHDCPHCHTANQSLKAFGIIKCLVATLATGKQNGVAIAFLCPSAECGEFSLFKITNRPGGSSRSVSDLPAMMHDNSVHAISEAGYIVKLIVYPPALFSDIPPDLPESVERAYRQAERNRVQPDCEEPAATGYRRAIENAIKEKHPETKGPLRDRIRKLGDSGNLPKDMVAWAHQVRILGNDGAHELDGVTREEVEQARGFADAFLRYLISMPVMVEQVRKKTAVPAEAEVEPATEVGEISAAEG